MDYHDQNAGKARLAVAKYAATASQKAGTLFVNPGECQAFRSASPCADLASQVGPVTLESRPSRKAGRTSARFSREPSTLSPGILVASVSLHCMCPLLSHKAIPRIPLLPSPGAVTCFDSQTEEDAFFNNTIVRKINYTIAGKFDQQDSDELFSHADESSNVLLEFGKRCQQGPVGNFLQYIGTSSTVRDLVSLGDCIVGQGKPIDYWGFSYGTVIGANFLNSESRIKHSYSLFLTICPQCSPRSVASCVGSTRVLTPPSSAPAM
jgi:hypothetical protein